MYMLPSSTRSPGVGVSREVSPNFLQGFHPLSAVFYMLMLPIPGSCLRRPSQKSEKGRAGADSYLVRARSIGRAVGEIDQVRGQQMLIVV
jgi:hypothetical protein